jgi:hemoglobin-like flavoprotein
MGASASILVSSSSLLISQRSKAEFESLPMLLGPGVDLSSSYGPITPQLVQICERSWLRVALNNTMSDRPHSQRDQGLMAFCYSFFSNVTSLDPENEVVVLLQPKRTSHYYSREALLLRIVKYILSVPGESFKVKSKIRSLGRAHARRGIVEKHFLLFNKALLISLAERLEWQATYEVMKAWNDLIAFVTHQLTFDKVFFRSHHTVDADADRESLLKTQEAIKLAAPSVPDLSLVELEAPALICMLGEPSANRSISCSCPDLVGGTMRGEKPIQVSSSSRLSTTRPSKQASAPTTGRIKGSIAEDASTEPAVSVATYHADDERIGHGRQSGSGVPFQLDLPLSASQSNSRLISGTPTARSPGKRPSARACDDLFVYI